MQVSKLVGILMVLLFVSSCKDPEATSAFGFNGQFNRLIIESDYPVEFSATDTINPDTPDWVVGFQNITIIVNEAPNGSYTLSVRGERINVPEYSVVTVLPDGELEIKQDKVAFNGSKSLNENWKK